MKIEFDPFDLKKKYQTKGGDPTISTRLVTYEHLNAKAQKILDITGRAMFFAWDRQTYNAVFRPQPTSSPRPPARPGIKPRTIRCKGWRPVKERKSP